MNKAKLFLTLFLLSFFSVFTSKITYSVESGTWNIAHIYRGDNILVASSNIVYTRWTWSPNINFEGVHSYKLSPNTSTILKKNIFVDNHYSGEYQLKITTKDNSDFQLTTLNLMLDNKLIKPEDVIELTLGEEKLLEIYIKVPPNIGVGESADIIIEATEINTNKVFTDETKLIVEGSVQDVRLQLDASKNEVYVGEELTLMANFENHGDTVHSTQIMVDGDETKGVAMMMSMPMGFGLMGLTPPTHGTPIYKERDSEDNEFTKTVEDPTNVLKAGLLVDQLNAGEAIDIDVDVVVEEDAEEQNEFLPTLFYLNTDTMDDDSMQGDSVTVKKRELTEQPELIEIKKNIDKVKITKGEILTLDMSITNEVIDELETIQFNSLLPFGFSLVPDSVQSDSEKMPVENHSIDESNNLTIDLNGSLMKDESISVSYEVEVGEDSAIGFNTIETNGEAIGGFGLFSLTENIIEVEVEVKEEIKGEINSDFTLNQDNVLQGDSFAGSTIIKNTTDEELLQLTFNLNLPIGMELSKESINMDNFILDDNSFTEVDNIYSFSLYGNFPAGDINELNYSIVTSGEAKIGENKIEQSGEALGKNLYTINSNSQTIDVISIEDEKIEIEKKVERSIIKLGELAEYSLSFDNITPHKFEKIEFQHKFPKNMKLIEESITTIPILPISNIIYDSEDVGEDTIYTFVIDKPLDFEESISLKFNIEPNDENIQKENETMSIGKAYASSYRIYNSLWEKRIVYVTDKGQEEIKIKKEVDKNIVSFDEILTYNIEIENTTLETLKRIDILDILPEKFEIIADTVSMEDEKLELELIKDNNINNFFLVGELDIGKKVNITYQAKLDDDISIGKYSDSTILEGFGNQYYYDSNKNELEVEVIYNEEEKLIPITKEVNKKTISIGQLLKYTIKLKNNTEETLKYIEIDDKPPRGFKLLEESVETTSNISQIKTENNSTIKFKLIGNVLPDEEVSIVYYMRVENSTKLGNVVNTAWGMAQSINKHYKTTLASANTSVEDALFDQQGIIFGRVFIDTNKNNIFDNIEHDKDNNSDIKNEVEDENREVGVPGVKVYLENGDFAITDKFGMYSIYGQRAITHTVKIDRHTIPYLYDDGSNGKLSKITNKHNEKGDLSYADLKTAQLHKVNFAFIDVDEEFLKKVESRRNSEGAFYNELEYEFKRDYAVINNDTYNINYNTSQIKDGHAEVNFTFKENEEYENINLEESTQEDNDNLGDISLEDKLRLLKNDIDFMELKDNDFVGQKLRVRVKGPRGGYLNLYINDELVPLEKIGLRASSQENNLFFLEYSLIELEKGKNKLTVAYSDMFQIERERKSITVIATGEQKDFDIEVLSDPIADPTQAIEIRLKAMDKNNNNSLDLMSIEAEVDKGKWLDESLDKQDNILNVVGDNGEYIFKYIPTDRVEEVKFRFTSKGITKDFNLKLLPNLRPFTLSGIAEARYDKSLSKKDDNSIDNYIFEDNLNNFDPIAQQNLSNRFAVFGKGSVWNQYLLTFSYDNDKQERNFFKDISTEKYYPIYGDSSIRGFEAKSTSDLYLKIEKNHSSFLYGDYAADWTKDETSRLGKINRTLTGAYHKYDSNNLLINTFIAQTQYTHTSDEMRGLGISGPYNLSKSDIVVGSETITIITRDNVSNSIIIKEETLSRFQDYTIDYNSASIYFLEPKMSIDENGNPIFIKVDYEVEGSGEEHIVWGNHLEYTIKDNLTLGWNYAKDNNPSNYLELKSVFGKLEFSETTYLTMEFAKSYTKDFGKGDAFTTNFVLEEGNHLIEFEYLNTNHSFYNPSSSVTNSIEANTFKYELNLEEFKFITTAKYEENREFKTSDLEVLSGIEKKINENLDSKLYLRYALEKGDKRHDSTSIGLRFNQKILQLTGLSTFIEYEQDITDFDKRRLALGGDYKFAEKTTLYIRQELLSTYEESYALSPTDGSNSTLVGIKSDYFSVATLFSEYAVLNSTSEKEAKASAGVKKDIEISEELSVGVTLEKIFPLKYDDSSKEEDITSGTFSYFWNPDSSLKTTGNFEGSHSDKKYLFTNKFNLVKKYNEERSFIIKERYLWNRTINDDGKDDQHKGRLTLGFAHRDFDDDVSNWLFKYDLNYIHEENNEYTHVSNILSYSINKQTSEVSTNTLTLAGKHVYEKYSSYTSNYSAYMAAYNYNRDLTDRIDMNLNAIIYGDENFKEFKYGLGAEIGVRVVDNFWLSAGYNITGFVDDEFDEFGYFKEGVYIRFRVYIDEDIFNIRKNRQ